LTNAMLNYAFASVAVIPFKSDDQRPVNHNVYYHNIR
jgi:hypothetical protein